MSQTPSRPPIHPLTIWVPIIIMALGLVVFWNYLVKLKHDQTNGHLPIMGRLEKNLALTERSGKRVELKDLKGKILVASWVYTRCLQGCSGVISELNKLHKDVESDPGIQFLSFSVDPDDTPDNLKKFAESYGIKGDNWWFLTGPKDELRFYMNRYFGFDEVHDKPPAERATPDDKFVHSLKTALVDGQGQVRGFYDIGPQVDQETNALFQEKIRKDIQTLVAERDHVKPSNIGFNAFAILIALCVGGLIWMRLREPRRTAAAATHPSS